MDSKLKFVLTTIPCSPECEDGILADPTQNLRYHPTGLLWCGEVVPFSPTLNLSLTFRDPQSLKISPMLGRVRVFLLNLEKVGDSPFSCTDLRKETVSLGLVVGFYSSHLYSLIFGLFRSTVYNLIQGRGLKAQNRTELLKLSKDGVCVCV